MEPCGVTVELTGKVASGTICAFSAIEGAAIGERATAQAIAEAIWQIV